MSYHRLFYVLLLLAFATPSSAQDGSDPAEALKLTAIEALISAPEEKALPIVERVLANDGSTPAMRERALFVLSQSESGPARVLLLSIARDPDDDMRHEAIRVIGIGGHPETLRELAAIYQEGDLGVRRAVLEAYLIADDAESVFRLAEAASSEDEFAAAVEALGHMGALDELRRLRDSAGWSASLISAYAVAGGVESLTALATDGSDESRQIRAIEGLAIAGAERAAPTLRQLYREAASSAVRDAALQGLLIVGDEAGVLELFQTSDDPEEKRQLLELLVSMDSEAVWDIVDATLAN